ncbi:AAA domain-containing protein [Metamycoplasma hyosynoviae]|uniref:AAA domain-containing protein n=1 Tax=Metamycoplasma hyosynoviae TaxID=29559 RepID=UPI002358817A|nr:DEAD/DEAH box helicase [Metamycoplasma hyosynoviae]MDC8920458.1 DEAD/DEAH box helicase [Metamycoplasma hyosynoviae]MDD1365897.1 DEAD/DEAH box helicase [Metamycoplasma hyosynoviae]MDD7895163.1 DEAD/DEAH box helicase [Metamycoplasma hyosynoviae]
MNNKGKYQNLLNNLLNIDPFDSSLYCRVNNENFFDVYEYFGEKIAANVLNNFSLNILLSDNKKRQMIQKLRNASYSDEIIRIYNENGIKLNENLFDSKNFDDVKQGLLIDMEVEQQKSIVMWKKIINKANDINAETNIWPLHIGFFILSVETDKKVIHAPLFFKEVNIEIKNSLAYMYSNSDIKINEKLITFLNQEGFAININDFDFSNLTINSIFNYFKKAWSSLYEIPETLLSEVEKQNQNTIKNRSIIFSTGMILGFFNVSSGYLWNQLKMIIDNDEFEDIINPDFNKIKYKEKVDKIIFDNLFKLYKIQNTNFSQDCATVSALYQDTIIWGPPGTGKSQTISNLIVNIIARGYTALVVSQKKAALDVLKNRLKKLSIFCLFALNDKSLKNETFYKPLKEFIYLLENFKPTEKEEPLSIWSKKEEEYIARLQKILKVKNIDQNLEFYFNINKEFITEDNIVLIKKLNKNIKYNTAELDDINNLKKHLYKANFQKNYNILKPYPKQLKDALEILIENQQLLQLDLDILVKNIEKIDIDSLKKIINFFESESFKTELFINDDLKIARMILSKTIDKMNDFTNEQKKQYTSFAMAIRTAHLRPFKFFQKYKEMIKLLFPIIITTPDVDLSIWKKGEFDYAILDESSQIFIEKGIPILYLAKRHILAGDSKQMQPTRWFSSSYSAEEEEDFASIESLLDYATARGMYSVLLDKNYRSKKAALMTFNSKNFYDSKLDVIDENFEKNKLNDAIEVVEANGVWDNSCNKEEAAIMLSKIKENLGKYEKIIALVFNSKQQDYLLSLIFNEEEQIEEAINNETLQIKNIENIQGDEADLIIMSVVYDHKTSLHGTYVARKGGKNALNVAISRAKEKLIVIKSINYKDIEINDKSSSDLILFREWLRFLDLNPEQKNKYLLIPNKNVKEATEEIAVYTGDLYEELTNLIKDGLPERYKLLTNYTIGTKEIDFCIYDKELDNVKLGIIIDNLSYQTEYKDYLLFKDTIKFLISKKYPIIVLSKLNFSLIMKKISLFLKELNNEQ